MLRYEASEHAIKSYELQIFPNSLMLSHFVLHAHFHVIVLRWCDFVQTLLFPPLPQPCHSLCYFTSDTSSVIFPVTSPLPRPLLLPLCYFLRYFSSITPCYFSLPLPVLLLFCHFLCYFPSVTSYYISLPFSALLPLCYFLLLPLCHTLCHIPSVTSYYFRCHIVCFILLPFPVTSSATSCVTSTLTLP